jgi:predicted peptidase
MSITPMTLRRSPVQSTHGWFAGTGFAVCLAGFAFSLPHHTRAEETPVQAVTAPAQAPAETKVDITTLYEERSVSVAEGNATVEFRYRLLRPAATDGDGRDGQRYPLVLFLHGAGERGHDNVMQLKYLPTWLAEPPLRQRHPCFVLTPQCRMDERWVDVSWADVRSTPQPATPTVDLAAAIKALEETLLREAVDPARVYLTGLSMGGYGTWDLAARQPDRFAAILPVCGGGDDGVAARIAALPMWCFHGDADTAVSVERSRSMIAAVRAAGGRPIYSELAGVGHDSWTPAYRDRFVLDWLFSQRK